MKQPDLRLLLCPTRAHCHTCRADDDESADWRERVTGVRDFECPHGVTADNLPSRGLGDTIAKATRAVGVKPCVRCKKRQKELNDLIPYRS